MAESASLAEVTARHTPRKRRARLTPEEQRQIVGLYADPDVSTAEIRQRFAITDTSLYRLLQKHGVALRGRSASRAAPDGARSRQPRVRDRHRSPPGGQRVQKRGDIARRSREAGVPRRIPHRTSCRSRQCARRTPTSGACRRNRGDSHRPPVSSPGLPDWKREPRRQRQAPECIM